MLVMHENQAAALLSLFDEIPALFHLLQTVVAQVHGGDVSTAGRRGVLRNLDRHGPQTVPQMARARSVSRQHIQVLVNGLLADRLVASEENPAHRKSPLLRLTARGKRGLLATKKREARLLSQLRIDLSASEIDRVTDALRSLRDLLESKEWSSHVTSSD